MGEILVIVGALAILALSVASMNIYRWRTDVLTGPYIARGDNRAPLSRPRRLATHRQAGIKRAQPR